LTTNRNAAPTGANVGDLTIIEMLARYMPYVKQHYRHDGPTGEIDNIKYAIRPLKSLYGRTPVKDFGPLALKALQGHLIAQRTLARSTINARINIIRRVFRWAVSEQLCPSSVIWALNTVMGLQAGRTAAKEAPPVEPVADSVVEATLNHLPKVVADMVRLQRLMGCRPGEICIMRPIDVDRSGEVWSYRPVKHKNNHRGKQRNIPVGPRAQAILRPYLLRDAQEYCFRPIDSERQRRALLRKSRRTPVQPSQLDRRKRRPQRTPGPCYAVVAYRRSITRGCDAAFPTPDNLPVSEHKAWRLANRWHPNRLRHTAATEIRKKFGVEAARNVLGHSKVSTTEIYAERDQQGAADIVRQIG
jgi:integrase